MDQLCHTRMNQSCRTHMNELCHTYELVMLHTYGSIMSHIWGSGCDMSRGKYRWIMSHIWIPHLAPIIRGYIVRACVCVCWYERERVSVFVCGWVCAWVCVRAYLFMNVSRGTYKKKRQTWIWVIMHTSKWQDTGMACLRDTWKMIGLFCKRAL